MKNFLATSLIITGVSCSLALSAQAKGPDYVPQGHLYTQDSPNLPNPNSRQAEINRRADEIQVQRYQQELRVRKYYEYMKLNRFDFGNANNVVDNW